MSDDRRPLEPEGGGYLHQGEAVVGEPPDPASLEKGYEKDDASVGTLLRFGGILLVAILMAVGVLVVLFNVLEGRAAESDQPISPLIQIQPTPPGPRLQPNPALDWAELREQQESLLGGYSWVDEESGVVRIPIDEAMERLIEEGLPAREDGGGGQ